MSKPKVPIMLLIGSKRTKSREGIHLKSPNKAKVYAAIEQARKDGIGAIYVYGRLSAAFHILSYYFVMYQTKYLDGDFSNEVLN